MPTPPGNSEDGPSNDTSHAEKDPIAAILESPLRDQGDPGARQSHRWRWIGAASAICVAAVVYLVVATGGAPPSGSSTAVQSSTSSTGSSIASGLALTEEVPAVGAFGETAYLPGLQRVALLGGVQILGGGTESGAEGTWLFDTDLDVWLRVGPIQELPARFGHALATTGDDHIVVFGGATDVRVNVCADAGWCAPQALGDTWVWDPTTGFWTAVYPPASPSARYGSAMVFDPTSGRIILFGGSETAGINEDAPLLGDTWAYYPTTNQWTDLQPALSPSPRAWHHLLFDPTTNRVLMVGGIGPGSDQTWAFDPATNTWEELEDNPIGSRWGVAATLDPRTGDIYALGGEARTQEQIAGGTSTTLTLSDEVWVRHGTAWQQIDAFPFPMAGSATYDPETQQIVAYASSMTSYGSFTGVFDTATGEWTILNDSSG
jgi:hypothetical protein